MRLQLRQDQTAALGRLAAERGTTVSDLVRQAIDLLLASLPPTSDGAEPESAPAVSEPANEGSIVDAEEQAEADVPAVGEQGSP
jgi:hypothetical protein